MSRFSQRRPSPALIVAGIALVIGMAGTAIAQPNGTSNKISKAKVKAIANSQITARAPSLSVEHADSATTADRAKVADRAKIASNIYSAMVRDDGLMLGSIPGGATSNRTDEGFYRVNFGRDITGCNISASTASGDNIIPASHVSVGVFDSNTLLVIGLIPFEGHVDTDLYVQMVCPAAS